MVLINSSHKLSRIRIVTICEQDFIAGYCGPDVQLSQDVYTLKEPVLNSIFKRCIALVSCTGTVTQESSKKNLQIFTCNSEGFI